MGKYFAFVALSVFLFFGPARAQQQNADQARQTSQVIMTLISTGKYAEVWDSHMSNFFKSRVTRDSFLANLTIGRQSLGKYASGVIVDTSFSNNDPTTGYTGVIYAINYRNQYAGISLFERVVLIKEGGPEFKLAGFWAAPAQ